MNVIKTALPGVLIFEPKVFGDDRGFFVELFHRDRYRDLGLSEDFVQDNLSYSRKGVLRGLHFQNPHSQGKLVTVLDGSVFDVAVDIRVGSPTFGQSAWFVLDGKSKKQAFIPPGFAHGFVVTSDTALFSYKCTDVYHPEAEGTVLWNDPALKIEWPLAEIGEPGLSEKDKYGTRLCDVPKNRLPIYQGA
jgi:dTDP-4-dehydrorhamnose 3,5-epimerase